MKRNEKTINKILSAVTPVPGAAAVCEEGAKWDT